MNNAAYNFGIQLALRDAGLVKTAYSARMNIVPAGVGAGLGLGLGSMLANKLPGIGKFLMLPLAAGGAVAGLHAGHRLQGGI